MTQTTKPASCAGCSDLHFLQTSVGVRTAQGLN